jgi:hypothetical protein
MVLHAVRSNLVVPHLIVLAVENTFSMPLNLNLLVVLVPMESVEYVD